MRPLNRAQTAPDLDGWATSRPLNFRQDFSRHDGVRDNLRRNRLLRTAPATPLRHPVVITQLARRRSAVDRAATLLWAAAFLMACLAGIVAARDSVVAAMPRSAAIFEALGIELGYPGLALGDVTSQTMRSEGRLVLVSEGQIRNHTRREIPLPAIHLAVLGASGETLYHWTVTPAKPVLGPGESLPFRAQLAAPPEGGRSVAVTLRSVISRTGIASAAP